MNNHFLSYIFSPLNNPKPWTFVRKITLTFRIYEEFSPNRSFLNPQYLVKHITQRILPNYFIIEERESNQSILSS